MLTFYHHKFVHVAQVITTKLIGFFTASNPNTKVSVNYTFKILIKVLQVLVSTTDSREGEHRVNTHK